MSGKKMRIVLTEVQATFTQPLTRHVQVVISNKKVYVNKQKRMFQA